jgi:hypothetical protein
MNTSDLFLLMAVVAIAPHMSKGFGLLLWAINMGFFIALTIAGK